MENVDLSYSKNFSFRQWKDLFDSILFNSALTVSTINAKACELNDKKVIGIINGAQRGLIRRDESVNFDGRIKLFNQLKIK